MIEYLLLVVLSLICGISVKYTDILEDSRKTKTINRILHGGIYGLLLFIIILLFPNVASLWVGTVIGLLLIGKIDGLGHYVGVGLFLLLVILQKFEVSILLASIFVVVNVLEEIIHDKFKKEIGERGIKKRFIRKIISYRPLLEITTFVLSAVSGNWALWIALLSFDVGYIFIKKFE